MAVDLDKAINRVAAQHGIKLERDDPILSTVLLNEVVLEETVKRLSQRLPQARWWVVAWLVVMTCLGMAGLGGYWLGYQRGSEDQAVLQGSQGQAAVRLAEMGVAQDLANCEGRGWIKRNGRCYVSPVEGQVYGWRVK
jgi:hypothetical protein